MSFVVADRVKETTTVVGTGAIPLGGAPTGYQSFSVIGNGNSTFYSITFGNTTQWETGIGTYNSTTNTLSRDTVLSSSNSNALVNFFAGAKTVVLAQPSERAVYAVNGEIVAANGATLPVSGGGTGGTNAADARTNLGAQTALVSGANIKTVNSTSLLGSGDVAVQPTLVSGTNIKTVNGGNILGSGNLVVSLSPAGANTQVQYNNAGSFAGSSAFTFDGSQIAVNGVTLGRGAGNIATNTAVGAAALAANTTGSNAVAIGNQALKANTIGSANVAIGDRALQQATTASSNIAIGYQAMFSTLTANDNIAIGYKALYSNYTGGSTANTAIGFQALYSCSGGYFNVALGYQSLYNTTTGSGNTGISPYTAAGVYSPVFNPTTENNRLCLGSTAVTNAYVQVAWTVVSDARDKTDFAPVPHGLDFVLKLKPTAYRYKMTRDSVEGHGPLRYGFKAQDVLAEEISSGAIPVIVDADDEDKLRFNDQALIAVLVNAIQELKQQFDSYVAANPSKI